MKLLPHLHVSLLNTAKTWSTERTAVKTSSVTRFWVSSTSKYLRLWERQRGVQKISKRKKCNKVKEYKWKRVNRLCGQTGRGGKGKTNYNTPSFMNNVKTSSVYKICSAFCNEIFNYYLFILPCICLDQGTADHTTRVL